MSAFSDLLGSELLGKNDEKLDTASALQEVDAVGLYFSAHWCGPCRGFTPKLAERYTEYLAKGLKFQIVFISSDSDPESFKSYFGEMPWIALPFERSDIKKTLSSKYKVSGIPTLVIVGKNGETITTDGRSVVMEDKEGAEFPWHPPKFSDVVPKELVKKDGTTVAWESLAGKTIGLYFSAHWCPPCRGFTPKLAETYNKVTEAGKPLEIVFVSSDKDEASFNEYYGEMPWLALPYSERKTKEKLSKIFEVAGIPTFVLIDHLGEVSNPNARGAVSGDPDGLEFPWLPKLVNDLDTPDGINDSASFILFTESVDSDRSKELLDAFTKVAESSKAAKHGFLFFVERKPSDVGSRVRELTHLPNKAGAQVVVLDIGDESFGLFPHDEVDFESLKKFVDDFKSGTVEKKPFNA